MNHRRVRKDMELYEFSDILDFVEYTSAVPETNYSKQFHGKDDRSFYGGSFAEAVTQGKTGNPELVHSISYGVGAISAMLETERIGEVRDVTGEYFDVADFLSGEPEVFRREEFVDRKPVVPVYANFCVDSGVSAKCIRNRGCSIVALCDELSRSGFIVDLHLVHCAEYDDMKYCTNIALQNDPLDLDTVAFVMANPLCLRRQWFAALERYTGEDNCGVYGRPREYEVDEVSSGFLFVSSRHNEFSSRCYETLEAAKNHVLGMIEQYKAFPDRVIFG